MLGLEPSAQQQRRDAVDLAEPAGVDRDHPGQDRIELGLRGGDRSGVARGEPVVVAMVAERRGQRR